MFKVALKRKEVLKAKAVSYVEKEGFSVFEAKVFFANKRLVLKMLVDFLEGGISLEDCSLLNRKLSEYIEENNLWESSYLVEVCSPGIKREFNQVKDFIRIKGKVVDIWLNEPIEERSHYGGEVLEVNDDKVSIDTKNKRLDIPVGLIRKAKQRIG